MELEKTMSVKEVSDVLGVSIRTIQEWVKDCFPEIVKNGIETRLNQYHITEIKKRMNINNNLASAREVLTDIDMQEMTLKVIQYHVDKYNDLKNKLNQSENRVNRLVHDSKTYTTTEIAKELSFKSAVELNKTLESMGIQYKVNNTWVLCAQYSSNGYDSIKQEELDNGMIIYNRHWTGKGRDFLLTFFKDIE
jgi:transposase